MKVVIFAGGVGTRLWPLSRKKSPKQFEHIVGNKSTLQIVVDRMRPLFKPEDIFISTGSQYVELVAQQLHDVPRTNIFGEPAKKDVGPAVAYVLGYLAKRFPDEAVIILWSDHLVKQEKKFLDIVATAREVVESDHEKIVFIGQKPRFASDNLGWIETNEVVKEVNGHQFRAFKGFKYRPNRDVAEKWFQDEHFCWNLGYFVTMPKFVYSLFEKFAPEIYQVTEKILSSTEPHVFAENLEKYYQEMPEVNFDNAILEKLEKECAYVVIEDIGWSDVGAWEALKEALETHKNDNVVKGKVMLEDSTDNLVYNYDGDKLIVGVDLEEILVVNTPDVLLVARKTSVGKVKKIVESFQGTEHEELT